MARIKETDDLSRHINLLKAHSSKDETRPGLKNIMVDHNLKVFFSTDGHRLFASRLAYSMLSHQTKPGIVNYIVTPAAGSYILFPSDSPEYAPNLRQFIPNGYTIETTLIFPDWFKLLERKDHKKAMRGSMVLDFRWEKPQICIGTALPGDQKNVYAFNIVFFADLAQFNEVNIGLGKENSPALVWFGESLAQSDWFTIIMPVRLNQVDSLIEIKNETPKAQKAKKQKEVKHEKNNEHTTAVAV
ncbi:MAG: hypothetical protein ACXVCY_04525 [Pseudobdellovibrionaceae bacterium]